MEKVSRGKMKAANQSVNQSKKTNS